MAPTTGITPRVVTLRINEQDISGREDETILELAQENDIFIPTLCHLAGLTDIGACRLCLVEVKGSTKLFPACVLHPTEGMEVMTDSPRLHKHRQMIVEMLFAEGNHVCSVCVSNGHCDLQGLAENLGMNKVRLEYHHQAREVDGTHKRFVYDENRCVLCTRCVRVCDEIEGAHTWDVMGRGIDSKVITDMATPWGESETCTGCSKCVQVCPTGALVEKGKGASEMLKRREFIVGLQEVRGGRR